MNLQHWKAPAANRASRSGDVTNRGGGPKSYVTLPYNLQVHGTTGFMFTLAEMRKFVSVLEGSELVVSATLQHWHGLEYKESAAHAWIYSSRPHIKFLGGTVRIFKPGQPFKVYVSGRNVIQVCCCPES